MAAGSYTISVRPLRLAFLVDPQEVSGLQQAIEINSVLWGGMFNPIIPTFRRTPSKWEPRGLPVQNPRPSEIISGYLSGFDPDFVVKIGSCVNREIDVGHREVVDAGEFIEPLVGKGSCRYGISIFEVLRDVVSKELKYLRLNPLRLILPTYSRAYRRFLSSVFGILPPDVQRVIEEHFHGELGQTQCFCKLDNYATLLRPRTLYPSKFTSWNLERRFSEATLFVLDATRPLDIIDYWNLRAAGHYVLPIPIQAANYENVRTMAKTFIEENYVPYRRNPDMYHRTTFQVSRYLSDKNVIGFANSLNISPGKGDNNPKYTVRWWYPRIWDSWARSNASEEIVFQRSHEVEYSLPDSQRRLELRSENPKFDISAPYTGSPRFANEFFFRFYEQDEPMAEVFPEGGHSLAAGIDATRHHGWRFASTGPVFLANADNDLIFLDLPRAEPLMVTWLRNYGWKAELSPAGRIAKQIFRQLGGLPLCQGSCRPA